MASKRSRWDLPGPSAIDKAPSPGSSPMDHAKEGDNRRSTSVIADETVDVGEALDDEHFPAFYPLPPLQMDATVDGKVRDESDKYNEEVNESVIDPRTSTSPVMTGRLDEAGPMQAPSTETHSSLATPLPVQSVSKITTTEASTAPRSGASAVQPLHLGATMLPPLRFSMDQPNSLTFSLSSVPPTPGKKLPSRPTWLNSPVAGSLTESKTNKSSESSNPAGLSPSTTLGASSPPSDEVAKSKKLTKTEVAAAAAEAAKVAAAIAASLKSQVIGRPQLPSKPISAPTDATKPTQAPRTSLPHLNLALPAKPAIADLSEEELERQWMEKEQEAAAKLEQERKRAEEEALAKRKKEEAEAAAKEEEERKRKEEEAAAKLAREAQERAQDPEGLTVEERARANKLAELKAKFGKKPGEKRSLAEISEMEAQWPERKKTSSGKTRVSRWSQPIDETPFDKVPKPPRQKKQKPGRSSSFPNSSSHEQADTHEAHRAPVTLAPTAYGEDEYDPTAPPTLLFKPTAPNRPEMPEATYARPQGAGYNQGAVQPLQNHGPTFIGDIPIGAQWASEQQWHASSAEGPGNVSQYQHGGPAGGFGEGFEPNFGANGTGGYGASGYSESNGQGYKDQGPGYGSQGPSFGRPHPYARPRPSFADPRVGFAASPPQFTGPRPPFAGPGPRPMRPGPRPPAWTQEWSDPQAGPQGARPPLGRPFANGGQGSPLNSFPQPWGPPPQQSFGPRPPEVPGRSRSDGYRPSPRPQQNGYGGIPAHSGPAFGYGSPPQVSNAFEYAEYDQQDPQQPYPQQPYQQQGNYPDSFHQQQGYSDPSSAQYPGYQIPGH